MKKLFLGIAVLCLTSFTMANAPGPSSNEITRSHGIDVRSYSAIAGGMEFEVFVGEAKMNTYHIDLEVVNITKDKLEVEKLRLEIASLKKDTDNPYN